jgi:hypothetical protein
VETKQDVGLPEAPLVPREGQWAEFSAQLRHCLVWTDQSYLARKEGWPGAA